MTIEHADIPNAGLHEPKGITTAGAETAYVANGAGSGTWKKVQLDGSDTAVAGSLPVSNGAGGSTWVRYQGWGQYQDSRTTVGAPVQNIAAGGSADFICNGLFLTEERLPSDAIVPLWNASTNRHIPISAYDVYHIRISFTAENYSGTSPYIEMSLDIGGAPGIIYSDSRALRKGGAAETITFSFPVFSGTTYIANFGKFTLSYQGTGSCDIYKNSILIVRESKNFV